jgi:hypothetical protein
VSNADLRSDWYAMASVDGPRTVEAMFRFLGTNIRVESASVGLLQHWTAVYGAFRVAPGPAEITVRVHGEGDGDNLPAPGRVTIERDGVRQLWRGRGPVLPPLDTPPLDQWTYLRGAAVSRAGHAVLLLGDPGAGKTLLALSIAARGARLLADGLLPLDPADLLVAPFPEALRLGGEELAQLSIDPAHPALVPFRTTSGTIKWRADPGRLLGPCAARVTAEVAAIVFLQPVPADRAGEPRLEPLPAGQVLPRLYRHLHRPDDPNATASIPPRLCRTVPAYKLTVGGATATAQLLDQELLI